MDLHICTCKGTYQGYWGLSLLYDVVQLQVDQDPPIKIEIMNQDRQTDGKEGTFV